MCLTQEYTGYKCKLLLLVFTPEAHSHHLLQKHSPTNSIKFHFTSFTAFESTARMNLHFTLLPQINWRFLSKAPPWITQSTMMRLWKRKRNLPVSGGASSICSSLTQLCLSLECGTRCPSLPTWLAGWLLMSRLFKGSGDVLFSTCVCVCVGACTRASV